MYMWDKNWLWGCPYPKVPSNINLAIGIVQAVIAISTRVLTLLNYDETFNGYNVRPHNKWQFYFISLLFLSGLLSLVLSWRQYRIEQRRIFDSSLQIDETNLRINHYFKMKESIMSDLGYAVLLVGLLKFIAAYFYIRSSSIELQLSLLLALVDVLAIANIVLATIVLVISKLLTRKLCEYSPLWHMKIKAIVD